MSINTIGSPLNASSGLSEMIKRTMSEVDTNKDGQLSSTEFGAFLTNLLEGLSQKARPNSVSSASGSFKAAAEAAATSAADGPYFSVPGFDFGKLQNTTYVNGKYSPAVRAFSQAIAAENLAPVSGSLSKIVTYAKNNGFPDAKVSGEDEIDFGDGNGAIDVITEVGQPGSHWWFHN